MPDVESNQGASKGRHRTWYRVEQRRRRIRKWTAIGLVVLLPGAALIGHQSYKLSLKWKEMRAIHQGKAFIEKSDDASAIPHFLEAVQMNPNSREACRSLAEIYDRTKSPEALIWRQRLTQLEPGNASNWLALGITALRLGDWAAADVALSRSAEKLSGTARFHEIAAEVALAANRPIKEAESQYSQALALEPANETHQLNLARLQLRSADRQAKSAARQLLEKLKQKPQFELPALRALVTGLREEDSDTNLLTLAGELVSKPESTVADRLLLLEILQRRQKAAELSSRLSQLEEQSSAKADAVAQIVFWMNKHGLAAAATQWSTNLPPTVRNADLVPVALAESLETLRNWEGLYDWVHNLNWKENEFLRLAYSSRVEREKNELMEASDKWRLARHAVQGNPQGLMSLASLAQAWGWKSEAEELWWSIAKGDLNQRQALTKLEELYTAQRDAEGRQRVAKALYHLAPSDPAVMNECARLSLLVSKDTSLANQLAKEIYARDPKNPEFVQTYAVSLHQQGRDEEALKLFGHLDEQQLNEGKIGIYYGLILAATGQRELAAKYFANAEKNSQLLPEEKTLILQASKPLSLSPLAPAIKSDQH